MSQDPLRELHELIVAQLTDELSPAQHARLETLLDTDDLLRREYVEAMHDAAVLNHVLHVDGGETKTRLRTAYGFFNRPTPFSMMVAALVILMILTAMGFIAAPIYQQWANRIDLAPIRNDAVFVAELTDFDEAVWAQGQLSTHRGAHLVAGHQIQLKSGQVEVTFRSGPVVVVQGPANVELDGKQRLVLNRGKLIATVPHQAIGFEVATPAVTIVDLGTKFGVDVAEDQSGEVHVLEGRVEIGSSSTDSGEAKQILAAGQAWKFPASGSGGQSIESQPVRFALALAKPQVAIFQAGTPDPITGEDYDAVEDVQLLAWAPRENFGGRVDFDVGKAAARDARSLLRFDLSSLRGRVKSIRSVTLRLTANENAPFYPWRESGNVEAYRVTDANADWGQGSSATASTPGNPAAGDATWTRRSHPIEAWAGSDGAGTAGTDYLRAPLAARAYLPHSHGPFDLRCHGDLSFVQDWIDGKTNAGFLLRETTGRNNNRINFHSSESEDARARPQLIVVYVPLPTDSPDEGELAPELR